MLYYLTTSRSEVNLDWRSSATSHIVAGDSTPSKHATLHRKAKTAGSLTRPDHQPPSMESPGAPLPESGLSSRAYVACNESTSSSYVLSTRNHTYQSLPHSICLGFASKSARIRGFRSSYAGARVLARCSGDSEAVCECNGALHQLQHLLESDRSLALARH